eukprot:474879-Rhodomonas_salina.2
MQWKQRTGLDDAALAQLGSAEQQCSVQAAARGARLPGWPYLKQIMDVLGLDTIVGPSVFEASPTSLWTTASEDYEWAVSAAPLVFLEWVPPDSHSEILNHCQSQRIGIIARLNAISSAIEAKLDEKWTLHIVNGEYHFIHKPNWWLTGNQGLDKTKDVFTVWAQNPTPCFPLQRLGFQPPLPLLRLEAGDIRTYYDNTPSRPYRHLPGQHVWTDWSKIDTDDAQL